MPRRVAVLTTGRQDYGILRSTALAMSEDERFDLHLWAGGMHLDQEFGSTVELVEADGLEVARRLAFIGTPPDPVGDASEALLRGAIAVREEQPDCLMVVGDRSETLAAGVAAAIESCPIVHLHGGEETEGAIDNALGHTLTKLSHLHLTTHDTHAARVIQMGEAPSSVHVVGPPGLDNMFRSDPPTRAEILDSRGLADPHPEPLVLVTVHPTTLASVEECHEVKSIAAALERTSGATVMAMRERSGRGVKIGAWAGERASCDAGRPANRNAPGDLAP